MERSTVTGNGDVGNWCELTDCGPDRSDRSTTGGLLRGNTFDGAGMTEADAWVNVKGNHWLITGNTGIDSPEDGLQVFEILDGWGLDNTFTANTATVNGDGDGFDITRNDERNPVACDNAVVGATKGLTRGACT